MTDWHALVDYRTAVEQIAWERRWVIFRGAQEGLTYKQLGERLNLSRNGFTPKLVKALKERGKRSPVERWMEDLSELREFVKKHKEDDARKERLAARKDRLRSYEEPIALPRWPWWPR